MEVKLYLKIGDGIFDKLTNFDIVIIILETCLESIENNDTLEITLKKIVDKIIKEAIDRDSKDNLSCIFLFLNNLYNLYKIKDVTTLINAINDLRDNNKESNELYPQTVTKIFYNEEYISKRSKEYDKSNETKQNNFNKKTVKDSLKENNSFCCGIFSKKSVKISVKK